jgi:ubiquinone/menaquinone biosynthesis C-methylase UbiE
MSNNQFSENKEFVEEYELFGKVFPFHDDLQQVIVTSLREKITGRENLRFLDIGGGYGFTTKLVSKEFPNATYLLNEFDPVLLAKSTIYLEDLSCERLPGDIEEVIKSIPNESIDAVYSAWVIHNFPPTKRAAIMKEIGRIVKKGGIFVNLDKVCNTGPDRVGYLAQAILDLEPFISKYQRPDLFIEWVKHDLRDEELDLAFTDTENEQLLTENGFSYEYVKHILLEKVVVATKQS